jgi:hypothetical protein
MRLIIIAVVITFLLSGSEMELKLRYYQKRRPAPIRCMTDKEIDHYEYYSTLNLRHTFYWKQVRQMMDAYYWYLHSIECPPTEKRSR